MAKQICHVRITAAPTAFTKEICAIDDCNANLVRSHFVSLVALFEVRCSCFMYWQKNTKVSGKYVCFQGCECDEVREVFEFTFAVADVNDNDKVHVCFLGLCFRIALLHIFDMQEYTVKMKHQQVMQLWPEFSTENYNQGRQHKDAMAEFINTIVETEFMTQVYVWRSENSAEYSLTLFPVKLWYVNVSMELK
jgi:hypothetical protein